MSELSAALVDRLRSAGLDPTEVVTLVDAALAEDLAGGDDVTSMATVPGDATAEGVFVTRSGGVVAGVDIAMVVLERAARSPIRADRSVVDGAPVAPGQTLLTVRGRARDLLLAERTALNLIGHLSGVASVTRQWVDAIAGSSAAVRDTRKTTPMLRSLEKYAVRCGGGVNHRMTLSDAALVKDNHVLAAGSVVTAYRRVRASRPDIEIEVEVDNVADAVAVVEAGADQVLLDTVTVEGLA